jgi:hypothetical protein
LLLIISCSEGTRNEDTLVDESLIINKTEPLGRKYYIDSLKSIIYWVGSNAEARHYGIIHIKDGFLMIKDSMIVGGNISIRMSAIDIFDLKDNPAEFRKLSETLMSKDFFDVEKYPFARFEIDSVRELETRREFKMKTRNDMATFIPTHMIYGNFTMKGNTRQLSFPAKIDMRYYRFQGSSEFSLTRFELGINPPVRIGPESQRNEYVPDSVNIGLDIIASAR